MRRYVFRLAMISLAVLGPSVVRANDQEIAQQIVQKLQAEKQSGTLKGFSIDLSVEEGTVWLSGRVNDEDQQAKAPRHRPADSRRKAGRQSMASLASDCMEALDASGIVEPVVVCGLSMGGYVAFEMWNRYSARISAMILCDTRAVADTPEGVSQRLSIAERVAVEGTDVIVAPMLEKLLARDTRLHSPSIVESLMAMMRKVSPGTIAFAQRAMAARADFREALEKITVPVLLVVGKFDAISSPDEMRGIADLIPNATFKIIEGSGHLPPLENPNRFNTVVAEFLIRHKVK